MAITIQNIMRKISHSQRSFAITGPVGLVPQELLDIIIAQLIHDKASLLSCALVHPSWTGISRYYLRSLNLLVSSPSRAKELHKLLRSQRETLSSSITGIILVGDAPVNDGAASGKSARARSYGKLLHFLKVKVIQLRSGAVEKDSSLVALLAQHCPDLTALRVACGSYQELPGFMRAISGSFSEIHELRIERGSAGLDVPDAPLFGLEHVKLSMPCLRNLRVVGWNNELVRWLGNNVVGTLERLDLESASMRSTCRIGEAAPLLGGNMETLKDLRMIYMKRDVAFDLSGLSQLRNLEVTSGMGDVESALLGWRLPRSLKRVYLRNVVRVLRVHAPVYYPAGSKEERVVFKGARLQDVLGI